MDISPILVERFGQTMREKLTTGERSTVVISAKCYQEVKARYLRDLP